MANFDTSNLLTAQTMVADKYKGQEMRMKPAPVFALLSGNSSILYQGVETLKTRDDRAIEAHLLARTKRSSGSARAHDHTGTLDDSAKITLTWTTKTDDFAISLKLLDKSVFDFNQVLANKLEQACMNVLEDKETEAIAYLQAQKATQQPSGLKNVSFNAGTLEIDATKKDRAIQMIKSALRQNYFRGGADIIGDSVFAADAEFIAMQGSGNATNYGFQFGGANIVESVELADASYTNGLAIAMPEGSVGALNWIPKQNRNGWGDYNSSVGGFGTFSFMGFTFALHGYAGRSDTSGSNGDTQDVTIEFEVSLDTSFNKAPLSYTTGRTNSVIHQFGLLS